MFEFKKHLPVQLDTLPVGVFNGHDVSLEEDRAAQEGRLNLTRKILKEPLKLSSRIHWTVGTKINWDQNSEDLQQYYGMDTYSHPLLIR